jgi:hypothetical protein
VTVVLLVAAGAVNRPEDEIVPAVAVHVTAVLLVLRTAAVNCWVRPAVTAALAGDTVMLMLGLDLPTTNVNCLAFFDDLSRAVTTNE